MATRSNRMTMEDLFPGGFRGLPSSDADLLAMAQEYAREALSSVPTGRVHVDELLHQANLAEQMIAAGFAPEAYQRLQAMGVGQGYMPPQAVDAFNRVALALYDAGLQDEGLGMYQRAPQRAYMDTRDIAREVQFAVELAQRGYADQAYQILQAVRPEPQGRFMDPRVREIYGGAAQMMADLMASDGTIPESEIRDIFSGLAYTPSGGSVPVQQRLQEYGLADSLRRILTGHRLDAEGRPGILPSVRQYILQDALDRDRSWFSQLLDELLGPR